MMLLMGSRRRVDAEHPAYVPGACDDDGRPQCRRCLGALTRPHSEYCCAACEFRVRASPACARRAVHRRDRGVCTHCRLDCGLLDRVIGRLRFGARGGPHLVREEATGECAQAVPSAEGEATALWLIEQLGLERRRRP